MNQIEEVKRMKKEMVAPIVSTFALASILVLAVPGVSSAKFTCDVDKIEGNTMVLKNCQERGLKRLHPGDKVGIIKKRVKKTAVEGC